MSVESKLAELQKKALEEPEIREALWKTREEEEPLEAFCRYARELGYEIYPGELLAAGEEFCAAMLRSVNGGGVEAPDDGWADAYDQFFAALQKTTVK